MMADDAGDVQQVTSKRKREAEEREADIEALRWVLSTHHGRRFVWKMLERCGVHHTSFVGEYPLTMARNEGRRSIGLEIENEVFTADPQSYNVMRTEAEEREYLRTRARKK